MKHRLAVALILLLFAPFVAFAQVTSIPCNQLPAITGLVTTTAGSCATSQTLGLAPKASKIYTISGASPTCAATGIGSTGACTLNTAGSSDLAGQMIMTPSGTGIAATGSVTLTFNSAYVISGAACAILPADNTGTWQNGVTVKQLSSSTSTPVFIWTNVATTLTSGQNYLMNYFCVGF